MPRLCGAPQTFTTTTDVLLIIELAQGGPLLEEIVRRGSMSERYAAACITQVAAALEYMHAKGIMHRDMKPENLLLVRNESSHPLVKARRTVEHIINEEVLPPTGHACCAAVLPLWPA